MRGARITPTVDPRGTHKSITYQIHSRLDWMKVSNRLAGKVREIRCRLIAVTGRGVAPRSHRRVHVANNRNPIGSRGVRVKGFPVFPSSVDLRVTVDQNIGRGACGEVARWGILCLILHSPGSELLKGRCGWSELRS